MSEQAVGVDQDDGAARKAARNGTLPGRVAFTDARRAEFAERDAERLRLAEELGSASGLAIPHERGYLSVGPETFGSETAAILEHANGLMDSLGHDALFEQGAKGGFIARGFLPEEAFGLDSPYMRFALSSRVVSPISAYLGVVPVLTDVDVWYSAHHPKALKSSQLWHLDHADTTQVKVWLHLSDIDEDSGPLTGLAADASEALAEEVGYDFGDGYRLADERAPQTGLFELTGPAGTVDFIDTSRCFHFGSRVSADGVPRRVLVLQYLTPYSFKFADHRDQAPFRALAPDAGSELEKLVLGAS